MWKKCFRKLLRIKVEIEKENAFRRILFLSLLASILYLCNYGRISKFGLRKIFASYSFEESEPLVSITTEENIPTLLSNLSCQPIRKNVDQYYVNIDGVTYPQFIPSLHNQSIDFDCLNVLNTTKKILNWNTFFGQNCFTFGCSKSFLKERVNCPLNCEMFDDKSRIDESDLILVHMIDPLGTMPQKRGPNQRWVFFLLESPLTFARNFNSLNGLFNYTATYRLDSDFKSLYFYNSFIWKRNTTFNLSHNFAQSKSRMAAAVISNCADSARRLDYVSEMQQVMSVDVFGKCGKPCVDKFSDGRPGKCKNIIAQEYLFYLAFENSVCKDYISEKFFDIIEQPIVPVVRGGGPYEFFVPKSAYIDANEFDSPQELAKYLVYLSKNSTAYNAYFKWKQHIVRPTRKVLFPPICDICIQLHLEEYYGKRGNQIIYDLENYWNRDTCHAFN